MMNIEPPNSQNVLAGLALTILGILGTLCFFIAVPATNKDLVIYILGAVSGALTVGGVKTIAGKITTSTGSDATIAADPTSQKDPTQ